MAEKKFSNAFAKFAGAKEKTAFIESLGEEVKYRELTMQEGDDFSKRLIKSYGDGTEGSKPEIDYDAAQEIKYEKCALILVEPKVTVDELKAMPASFMAVITEINGLVEESEDEITDSEGNSEG